MKKFRDVERDKANRATWCSQTLKSLEMAAPKNEKNIDLTVIKNILRNRMQIDEGEVEIKDTVRIGKLDADREGPPRLMKATLNGEDNITTVL